MLEQMRKQSQNGFLLIGLGIIIVVFIFFFGPQSSGFDPSNRRWAGEGAGETIYDTQVIAAYERYLALTQRRERLTDGEFSQRRRQIIADFAARELLAREARRAGLAVSNDELRCYIVNWHPGYTVKGERICRAFPSHYQTTYRNFDFAFYSDNGILVPSYRNEVRARFAMSVDDYEDAKRRELLALKYLDLLASGVSVSREEAIEIFVRRNETVTLEYVAFDPATSPDASPSDEEVEAFAEANEAAIAARWTTAREEYLDPRQVRLRRIFMNRGDTDAERATARERYEAALARAEAGAESFESLAREFSDLDTERESGGDFGWRSANEMSRQIADRTAQMQPGDVAGIEFDTYYNVIRLEEVREERVRPLDDVRSEIARALLIEQRRETSLDTLRAHASVLHERVLNERISIADALDALRAEHTAIDEDGAPVPSPFASFSAQTTSPIAREPQGDVLEGFGPNGTDFRMPPPPPDRIPGIGTSRSLARAIFELNEEAPTINRLVELDGKLFIVRLAEAVTYPTIPEDELAALRLELAAERAEAVTGHQLARNRLLLHFPGPSMGPVVDSLIERGIARGEIRFNESLLAFDPVDDLVR
jgi:parvulin-like peptidyl-prolyl isomerase